ILHVRPVLAEKKLINAKKREWVRLSVTFKASGGERFLVIGNFFNNQMTKMVTASDVGNPSFPPRQA
ncbi:MAG: hypothetical protein AAFV25_18350, partial [Bacteroidota bacterium]